MKQSSCDSASSELPKPEKEAQPDVEPHSNTPLQEKEAKFRSGWGLEAETEPLGAESGPEAKAKSLGANPRSGSGPEATAQPLDFVVAAEQDGTVCWPSETGVRRAGAQIALESAHVIDSGETALVEGLCVAPRERGKGVAGLLRRFCPQLVKTQNPGVKVARLTRDDQVGPRELKKHGLITKQEHPLGLSQCLRATGAAGRVQLAALRASVTSPRPCRRLAATWPASYCCLPCSATFTQDWQPYRPRESNLRLLAAKGLEWHVDSSARPRLPTLCTRPFPIPHGGDGTWRYLNVDAVRSAGAQAQSRLLRHLQGQAPRLSGLNAMRQLFLASQLWSQLADLCQAGLGLELVKGYTEQYPLEADI